MRTNGLSTDFIDFSIVNIENTIKNMVYSRPPVNAVFVRVYTVPKGESKSSSSIDKRCERGDRLAYSFRPMRFDSDERSTVNLLSSTCHTSANVTVPDDVLETFLDLYSTCYTMHFKRWSDGYGSVHYARRKTLPPFVETWSPRSHTYLHVDLSGLPLLPVFPLLEVPSASMKQ